MTLVGLITVCGLLLVLTYIAINPVEVKIKHLWGLLFGIFVIVSASHNADLTPMGHALAYGLLAVPTAAWVLYRFKGSWEGPAVALLFLINTLGNFAGLDQAKLWTVDALDVSAWAQIGLLYSLAWKHPKEVNDAASAPSADCEKGEDDKRLRLVGGRFGNPGTFKA